MIANLKKSKKKGFTLVELIVVIAIIAIIAAVAVPTTIKYVNEARVTTAKSETNSILSTIETGFTDLMATGDGVLDEGSLKELLDKMMPTTQHTDKVEVTAVTDGSFTITVVSTQNGANASKTYSTSSYALSIPAAITLTAPGSNSEAGWTAATAPSGT